MHQEAVRPALALLVEPAFKAANEEYLKAHKHFRKGEYGDCPRIEEVAWNRPALLHDEEMKITAYVTVSDPQGLSDIESVRLDSLIDYGREEIEWDTKGRNPLSAGADSAGSVLSDEGPDAEVGDERAGGPALEVYGPVAHGPGRVGWRAPERPGCEPYPRDRRCQQD